MDGKNNAEKCLNLRERVYSVIRSVITSLTDVTHMMHDMGITEDVWAYVCTDNKIVEKNRNASDSKKCYKKINHGSIREIVAGALCTYSPTHNLISAPFTGRVRSSFPLLASTPSQRPQRQI